MKTKRDYKSFDFFLVIFVASLAILGIILIGSAKDITTSDELHSDFVGQIIWVISGLVIMILMAFIDFQFICKFYIPIYILNIFLLIAVLVYGYINNYNAYRSIDIPGLGGIQPSEFNKIFMIIFLARYIDNNKEKINNILVLGSVVLLTVVPLILILIEPSLSASLVTVVIMAIMLFVAKLNYRYILIAFVVIIPLVFVISYDVGYAIIEKEEYQEESEVETKNENGETEIKTETKTKTKIIVTYDENSMSPILIDKILSPYQISRLKNFFEPYDEDATYQNRQALIAIGSGQLSGKGLFKGDVYVPYAANDFIFTVLAEEIGFVGCIATIFVVFIVVFRCIVIAMRSDIFYGKLIAGAVGGMLTFQTFCNVGVNTGLLPNTGMIFPFISAGGSAMWVFMALIGMVLNIGMTKTKPMFAD